MRRLAPVAVREVEREQPRAPERGLAELRGALASAGAAAREEVLVDFLDDDLRAAEAAVDDVHAYVSALGAALRTCRVRRSALLPLAMAGEPMESLDALQTTLDGLRRRLAAVALRLPR